jgi:transcriptional regulator with XRE-family HTH domain
VDAALAKFGHNLRHYRKLRRLSQEELADLCDMHRTSISKYERAKTWPGLKAIIELQRALALPSACHLLEGVD